MSKKMAEMTLPFGDLGWEEFEEFICQMVSLLEGVEHSTLYGRRGQSQKGIDGEILFTNGQNGAFQCKRVKNWSLKKTQDAIAKANKEYPDQDRYVLAIRCEAGAKERDEIKAHPNWELWDIKDLSRAIRNKIQEHQAIRLVRSWFGKEGVRAFFGITATLSLKRFEKRYFAFLNETDRLIHHRAKLVGRSSQLQELGAFVESDMKLGILSGRGGMGKSRLLIEFAKGFRTNHPQYVLRTLPFGRSISDDDLFGFASIGVVIVVEDAHRRNDLKEILLICELSDTKTKIVIETRPSGIQRIHRAYYDSAIDKTQVQPFSELGKLTPSETKELIKFVSENETDALISAVAQYALDAPFIAVVAAEMLRKGEITAESIRTDTNLRAEVEMRYYDDVFQDQSKEAKDALNIISALQPLSLEQTDIEERLATHIGISVDDLSDLVTGWIDKGILVENQNRLQIEPEMLSDLILLKACFNWQTNRPRNFVTNIVREFSDVDNLITNIAAVDWLNLEEKSGVEQSLLSIVWPEYRERFIQSRFFNRIELINIAERNQLAAFAPEFTEELIRLSFDLDSQPDNSAAIPKHNETISIGGWFNFVQADHAAVMWVSLGLLEQLAFYQPEKLDQCLDSLWNLGRDGPSETGQIPDHPIRRIENLATINWMDINEPTIYPDSIDRVASACDWVCRIVLQKDSFDGTHSPLDLFLPLLKRDSSLDRFTNYQFQSRTIPTPYDTVKTIREKIRLSLFSVIKEESEKSLKALQIAIRQLEPITRDDIPPKEKAKWDKDRIEFATSLINIYSSTDSLLIQHRIWSSFRILDDELFRSLSGSPSNELPDSIEREVIIVLRSEREVICPYHPDKDYEELESRWQDYKSTVARRVWQQYSTPIDFCEFLNSIGASLDGWVDLHPFIKVLLDVAPNCSVKVCEWIVKNSPCDFDSYFSPIFLSNKQNSPTDFDLLSRAAWSPHCSLSNSAIGVIWNRSKPSDWTLREKELLFEIVASADDRKVLKLIDSFEYPFSELSVEKLDVLTKIDFERYKPDISKVFYSLRAGHHDSISFINEMEPRLIEELFSILLVVDDLGDSEYFLHFIKNATNSHPKQSYEFFKNRISRFNCNEDYVALPFFKFNNGLKAFQQDNQYLSWVSESLENSKGESDASFYWGRLTKILLSDFPIQVQPILQSLISNDGEKGVETILRILGPHLGYFIFEQVELVKLILSASADVSPKFLATISERLNSGVGPLVRQITPGKPHQFDEYAKEAAERLAEKFRNDSILGGFYDAVFCRFDWQVQRAIDGYNEF